MVMQDENQNPSKRDSDATGRRARGVVLALLIAGGILAVFNSDALRSWSYDLSPNPVSEQVVFGVEFWHETMESVAVTRIREAIQTYLEDLAARRFGEE